MNALKNENLKYYWFDFHHECRKMKWENLSILVNDLSDDFDKVGYFEMTLTKDRN